ncbi:DeoR/GlpR family DNA-binding transcription regulator [Limnochorda pilosa]|uniref:DeoR faimly transcriptional regulator n=1 Tax=Limnochorda pilosa TaxID=1555112 RepID=A0A0K2SH17_LIMPI|nr:DeoR/GlpR family DNA-binding transcription regulator [Limnochorda pilosa]BAS26408.1 DeoR faimly transcriptional regulator [Limnochorda pilosa]
MQRLAVERRAEILRRLEAQGTVRVTDLSAEFAVTEETVRRDLDELEKEGLLQRIYGGAVSPKGLSYEPPVTRREARNRPQKQAIAQAAATRVTDGETILLDASTTALYVARALKARRRLTVLTNSLLILSELASNPDFTVMSTGGTLRQASYSFVGPQAQRLVGEFHMDRVFISGKGLTVEHGLTDSNELEVELKRAMVQAANEVVGIVDSSKIGYTGFATIIPVQRLDVLITDGGIPPEERARIEELGVDVVVAGEEGRDGRIPEG